MTQKAPIPRLVRGSVIGAALASVFAVLVIGYLVHRSSVATRLAEQQNAERVAALQSAVPTELKPDGPLREKVRELSDFMNTEADPEAAIRSIKGTIVEWTLTVFESEPQGAAFSVQTSDRNKVETLLTVIPTDASSKSRLKSLRFGDPITIRGVIRGIKMTRVEIDPAILIR